MRNIKVIEKYFQSAINDGTLRLTLEGDGWLRVEVKTPNSATPSKDGYNYTLVCAQNIREYTRVRELVNRITLLLSAGLAHARQDVNIMYKEWEPKR